MMLRQPILAELQYFLNGVNSLNSRTKFIGHEKLIKCSLVLLAELPAARSIVFDYFTIVFDASVANYMASLDKDQNGSFEDESILEIQDALENLVTTGASAWSPLISTWSLRLLGSLSDKHGERRLMDIGTACTFWLGSTAMRCLLGLTALCFDKLNSNETEICIANLLATFNQHSPHFNWVVARLGGCFPLKVISKILQCGLKGFSANQDVSLESEVEILGYLARSHEHELKFALKEMIVAIRNGNNAQLAANTIPYILYLAEMSEVLLQSISNLFLELFDENFVKMIRKQYMLWPSAYTSSGVIASLSKLILKTGHNGTKLILILAEVAQENPWCRELLEYTLVTLETQTLEDKPLPILKDLAKNESKKALWRCCLSDSLIIQQTAIWLLLLNSLRSPIIYYQTVCELLASSSSDIKRVSASSLIRLLGSTYGTEVIDAKSGLLLALERINLSRVSNDNISYNVLKNLVYIVQLENNDQSELNFKQKVMTTATIAVIEKILAIWDSLLSNVSKEIKPDSSIQHEQKKIKTEQIEEGEVEEQVVGDSHEEINLIAQLLEVLNINGKDTPLSMPNIIQMAQLTVKYFFYSLTEKDRTRRDQVIHRSYTLLTRQCVGRKAARSVAIRELLEGVLYTYGHLFGSQQPEEDDVVDVKKEEPLLKLNQQQGIALMGSRSLVLHAGIIGNGPKLPAKEAEGPQHDIKNIFINAIEACCSDPDQLSKIDGYNFVTLLLVEYLSTDVMYNGLPWPEEEFTKVTMERDLQIRRSFRKKPILWSILGLVATCRPSLCFASVILRALCASVLHQWRAKSSENINGNNNDLMFVTIELLKLLTLSQMLPPPLDYLYIVVPQLEPLEIAYLLRECVWNFMREYVPSPSLFGCDTTGLHWRDPKVARPPAQFIEPLKNTMQKNIKRFGALYYQMFCMNYFEAEEQKQVK